MAGTTTTSKRINLYQLSQEMGGAALRLVGTGDSVQPKTVKAPVATQTALDAAVAAHTFNAAIVPPPDTPLANQQTIAAALVQILPDMQAILDTADIPAGTLTAAQLSNFVRASQTQMKTIAQAIKRLDRYVTNDFTGTG